MSPLALHTGALAQAREICYNRWQGEMVMNFDDLKPRAKTVQPVRPPAASEVRFHRVLEERCASDGEYRALFEVVRSQLAAAQLEEIDHSFEQGLILTRFRWLHFFRLTLRLGFYSAGVSILFDADTRPGRGFFRFARKRRAMALVARLTSQAWPLAEVQAAMESHPETIRPPQHTVES